MEEDYSQNSFIEETEESQQVLPQKKESTQTKGILLKSPESNNMFSSNIPVSENSAKIASERVIKILPSSSGQAPEFISRSSSESSVSDAKNEAKPPANAK